MTSKLTIRVISLLLYFLLILNCISISQNSKSNQIDSLLDMANLFININEDSVDYFSKIAYKESEILLDYNSMLDAIVIRIKSRIKTGDLIKSKELCDTALTHATLHNLTNRLFQLSILRGNVYQAMGFDAEALELFIAADKRVRQPGFERDDMDLYYYMSMIYFDLGDLESGYFYLTKSLRLALNKGNDSDIFPIYYLFIATSTNNDTIQKYTWLADSLIEVNPRLTYEEVALRNIEALYSRANGDLAKAKSLYKRSIKVATENNFSDYLTILFNNYAYALMAEEKFDSAEIYLESALALSIKDGSLENESNIYDSYCDYYEKIGDWKNAYKYAELFIERDAQYREQQKAQKSLYLTAVYETEQKEKEILKKENEIAQLWLYFFAAVAVLIAAIGLIMYYKQKVSLGKSRVDAIEKGKSLELANAVIKAQDDERKRLAMDLHDGLGARLGTLRFAIDSCFKTHDKYNDVINSISQIHQNIRDLSHRMLPSQLEDSGLKEAIKDLITPINSTTKFKIHFDTSLESRLSNKLEINIYFIIYELINNATRHSIGKAIFVQLYTHDDIINLSVENGGNWYNYEKNSKGIGIKNIKTRVEYLQGKLTIESGNSETVTMIEIPISKND